MNKLIDYWEKSRIVIYKLLLVSAWLSLILGAFFKDYHTMVMGCFIILLDEFRSNRVSNLTTNIHLDSLIFEAFKEKEKREVQPNENNE